MDGATNQVPAKDPAAAREPDAIYQGGEVVARVVNAQVDTTAREIHFEELYNSEHLLLPEDCEFQNYRLLVDRIGDATRVDKSATHKGRVLRDVVAEILGYREQ